MIRRLMTHFGVAGRRSGARLFAAISDRARENHRWAISRKTNHRVEDFQIQFPTGSREKIRRNATPIAVGVAVIVSLVLIVSVVLNITRGQSSSAGELAGGTEFDGGQISGSDGDNTVGPMPQGTPETIAQGSGREGPVDPLETGLTPAAGQGGATPGNLAQLSPLPPPAGGSDQVAALPLRDRARSLIIGTGRVTGVYFPTGGAICEIYNQVDDAAGTRCTVSSSSGSVENLNALRRGAFDIAVVQSDWQFHAHEGSVRLEMPGPFNDLRALFSIYVEPMTIVARRDSGIAIVDDLPGHRVAMGEPDSGSYEAMRALMSAMSWSSTDFELLSTEPSSTYLEALCLGEVDAVVMVAGHPNGATMNITNSCDARLVDISGNTVERAIDETPYLATTVIPGGYYPGNPDPIQSFGVAATVVASETMPQADVHRIVRSIFENFDEFRALHPAFSGLKESDMITRALSAPLHRGALQYYRERGWM